MKILNNLRVSSIRIVMVALTLGILSQSSHLWGSQNNNNILEVEQKNNTKPNSYMIFRKEFKPTETIQATKFAGNLTITPAKDNEDSISISGASNYYTLAHSDTNSVLDISPKKGITDFSDAGFTVRLPKNWTGNIILELHKNMDVKIKDIQNKNVKIIADGKGDIKLENIITNSIHIKLKNKVDAYFKKIIVQKNCVAEIKDSSNLAFFQNFGNDSNLETLAKKYNPSFNLNGHNQKYPVNMIYQAFDSASPHNKKTLSIKASEEELKNVHNEYIRFIYKGNETDIEFHQKRVKAHKEIENFNPNKSSKMELVACKALLDFINSHQGKNIELYKKTDAYKELCRFFKNKNKSSNK